MHNLHENKRRSKKSEEDSDGEASEDEEDENDPEKQPKLKVAGFKHTSGTLVRQRVVGPYVCWANIVLAIILCGLDICSKSNFNN